MKIELRKYFKDRPGYEVVAKCIDNPNPMVVVRKLAKKSGVLEPRLAFAFGICYAAFGIGQRDFDAQNLPVRELTTTVPHTLYDLAIEETNEYETSHARHFNKMLTTTKRDV